MKPCIHILLVDDDTAVRKVLHDILSLLGYSVLCAAGGEEGWALFLERGARVVITDNLMDDMTGLELAARVKQQAPGTPVLLLSSIAPDGDGLCDAVLGKPVTYRDLEQCLVHLGVPPHRA